VVSNLFNLFKDRLKAQVVELNKIYEPLVAKSDAITPYAVIEYGPEVAGSSIFSEATIYVNIYTKLYSEVDTLTRKVANELNRYQGIRYYGTSGNPFFDSSLSLWVNTLVFDVGRVTTNI
jgi:hypothetical protein